MTPRTLDFFQKQFDDLFLKASTGCPVAVQEFFDKHAQHFLMVIRQRMTRKLRRLYDSEDFLQEVRTTLFEYQFEQDNFRTPAAFVSFVDRVVKNKVQQARRKYLGRPEANLDRDRALETLSAKEVNNMVDRQPTPSSDYAVKETWEAVLESFTAEHRQIAVLLRQGRKHYQIAYELHISEKTVGRVLKKLGEKLELPPPPPD
jgi:RNA polymerase sigma factor (sigma-70 family)